MRVTLNQGPPPHLLSAIEDQYHQFSLEINLSLMSEVTQRTMARLIKSQLREILAILLISFRIWREANGIATSVDQ
jgi:hypothetical protein